MDRNTTSPTAAVVALALLILPGVLRAAPPAEPLRLLVVTGGHAYATSFYSVFMDHPEWTWDHEYPAVQAFRGDLRTRYDVLVLYDMTREDIGARARDNLRAFVESGKGVVVLHHAVCTTGYGEWWTREVVGGVYLQQPGMGLPAASTYSHDESLVVRPVAEHPITAGLGELTLVDETYKGMWYSPAITVLMESDHPRGDKPVVWIGPSTTSRVAVIQLGHGPEAHRHAGFQELVQRAIRWSAGRLP